MRAVSVRLLLCLALLAVNNDNVVVAKSQKPQLHSTYDTTALVEADSKASATADALGLKLNESLETFAREKRESLIRQSKQVMLLREQWDVKNAELEAICAKHEKRCDRSTRELGHKRLLSAMAFVDSSRNEKARLTEELFLGLAELKMNVADAKMGISELAQSTIQTLGGTKRAEKEAEAVLDEPLSEVHSVEATVDTIMDASTTALAFAEFCFDIDVRSPTDMTQDENRQKFNDAVEVSLEMAYMQQERDVEIVGSILTFHDYIVTDDSSDGDLRALGSGANRLKSASTVGYKANDVTDKAISDVSGRRRKLLEEATEEFGEIFTSVILEVLDLAPDAKVTVFSCAQYVDQ